MTNREGGCGSSSRINRGKNHGRWCWKRCRSSWVKTYTALKTIEVILILLWDGKSWEHCSIHFNRIIAVALMRIDLKEDGAEADHWGGCCSYTDGGGGLDWWFRSRCIWKAALIAFTDRLDMEYEKNTTGSLTVSEKNDIGMGWELRWETLWEKHIWEVYQELSSGYLNFERSKCFEQAVGYRSQGQGSEMG